MNTSLPASVRPENHPNSLSTKSLLHGENPKTVRAGLTGSTLSACLSGKGAES